MVTWEGLEEAVAVADAGSFVGGAALLNVSTSHLSRAIARLEGRLGTVLFNRTTRRVSLTDSGRTFVEQSRRIIQERDELLSLIDGTGELQGDVRITCSIALGERFVASVVRRFAEAHPRLSISLDLTNRLIDLVGEGYDLAVRTGLVDDKRLITREIGHRTSQTCASPSYLDRAGCPDTVDDLRAHDCLIGTNSTWHFLERGVPRTFAPPGRWRCNNGAAVVEAAIAGMGISQLPSFYLRQPLLSASLVPILEENCPAPEPIWVAFPQRRILLPKVSQLADWLAAELPLAMAKG